MIFTLPAVGVVVWFTGEDSLVPHAALARHDPCTAGGHERAGYPPTEAAASMSHQLAGQPAPPCECRALAGSWSVPRSYSTTSTPFQNATRPAISAAAGLGSR